MKNLSLILGLILVFSISCKQGRKSADADTFKQYELVEIWRTDTTFRVPESVIYDEQRDILFVANMNFEARVKDGNGFISKLGTDGQIVELNWVDGMSSPKGMAIVNDKLYVTDIDEILEIDIEKGEITNRIRHDGLMMLNDLTSDPEGNLYVTDMDANKIYKYSSGQLTEWLATGLTSPNGLLVDGDRLLVASGDFSAIDINTKEKTVLTEGTNRGDGIVSIGVPGHYIVSDWEGEIFMIYPDNSKVSLLNTKDIGSNTADIWYIPGQNLLLVPTFLKHSVVGYKLTEKE